MAGLFGAKTNSSQTPSYTQLKLQTSALGLCIPIGWGRFRCGGNLIDYVGFQKHSPKKKKGKGGGGKGSTGAPTYTACVAIALCEGPAASVRQVWYNQSKGSLLSIGFGVFSGTVPQSPWSYLTSHHADHALTYEATAYVASVNSDLGS